MKIKRSIYLRPEWYYFPPAVLPGVLILGKAAGPLLLNLVQVRRQPAAASEYLPKHDQEAGVFRWMVIHVCIVRVESGYDVAQLRLHGW